ncbi:MAG: ATP-dependent 6-phosphofructokinase [Proteobacteria bacterium]|nr:ATP-dependent 6-phosphofructokinase [Pseudomonadota bacterium]
MARRVRPRCVGILTSGGDCQGLNAAIRAVGKTAINAYGMEVIGILDGFRGLVQNRSRRLTDDELSGILTHGGTILGTSRDKPDAFLMGDQVIDMTSTAVENYRRLHLDYLICLGGGGTQKNALKLLKRSDALRIITLPKTIDNDIAETDVSFGFDTAVQIATEAIDRLHSTASSHHRVMVVEVMGHKTGWLAAAAGLAGGADVVLIPEIPYSIDVVAADLIERSRKGKKFSIIAVAEGALSQQEARAKEEREQAKEHHGDKARAGRKSKEKDREKEKERAKESKASARGDDERSSSAAPPEPSPAPISVGVRIREELERRTRLQTRLTTLGHTQRGGTPSATDRILATKLGTRTVELMIEGLSGVMLAVRGEAIVPVPLEQVAGKRKVVPLDHPILQSLRQLHICLGSE